MGAYQALAEHGLRVPTDVSVVSLRRLRPRPVAPADAHLGGAPLRRARRPRRGAGARRAPGRRGHPDLDAVARGQSVRTATDARTASLFDLDDDWVWDFWTIRDGADHHLFFLHAPRTLGDPDLRHVNARVGHAVSTDLRSWTLLPEALGPQPAPAFDDIANWTGSCVRAPGRRLVAVHERALQPRGRSVQRFGAATSSDLTSWRRTDLVGRDRPALVRDAGPPRRDALARPVRHRRRGRLAPLPHRQGRARQLAGAHGNGVVAHLTSPDLRDLDGPAAARRADRAVRPARGRLARRGRGPLGPAVLLPVARGRRHRVGCRRRVVGGRGRAGAPVDLDRAVRLTSEDLYVGRVVETDQGPRFLAFENRGEDGGFTGGVIDPVQITWRADGAGVELRRRGPRPGWRP